MWQSLLFQVICMNKKTFKQRFEENYGAVRVPANNKRGYKVAYIYYKPWYAWGRSEEAVKKAKAFFTMVLALQLLLFFGASLQRDGINFEASVGIPLVFSACALIFEILGVVQFCAVKNKTTEQNYYDIDKKLRLSTAVYGCLLYTAAAGGIYYMINCSFSTMRILITVCYFASATLSLLIREYYKKIPLRTVKNDNFEKYEFIKKQSTFCDGEKRNGE